MPTSVSMLSGIAARRFLLKPGLAAEVIEKTARDWPGSTAEENVYRLVFNLKGGTGWRRKSGGDECVADKDWAIAGYLPGKRYEETVPTGAVSLAITIEANSLDKLPVPLSGVCEPIRFNDTRFFYDGTAQRLLEQLVLPNILCAQPNAPTLLQSVFLLIATVYNSFFMTEGENFKSVSQLEDSDFDQVSEFIRNNLATKINAASLARLLDMKPAEFEQHFQSRTGLNVAQYLCNCRMEKAKEFLVASPEKPLVEIALETGFSSQSHFCSKFKKELSFSPGAYRQRFLNLAELSHIPGNANDE